jgi:DNA-binding beta-propeller fold protein YncE
LISEYHQILLLFVRKNAKKVRFLSYPTLLITTIVAILYSPIFLFPMTMLFEDESALFLGIYNAEASSASSSSSIMQYGFINKWNNQFNRPSDISIDPTGQFVYVADTGNNRIQKFDSNGYVQNATALSTVGSFGSGLPQFNFPLGIAVDPTGRSVYVADTGNNRIQKLTGPLDDAHVVAWGSFGHENGAFFYPADIAVDSLGYVYVADTRNNRIQKFDSNGGFNTTWGSFGNTTSNGQFNFPLGIAVDPTGRSVYVADTGNNRIQKFHGNGTFITAWGSLGHENGKLSSPVSIDIDRTGKFLYVSDARNHRIQKFTENGAFITSWGSRCDLSTNFGCQDPDGSSGPRSLGDGQFSEPLGIALDPTGTFLNVIDSRNNRTQVFTPDIFNSTVTIGQSGNESWGYPALAESGNNVYVVWQGGKNSSAGENNDIFFRKSDDYGRNFGPTINLSNNTGASERPWITANGSNVYVAWKDDSIEPFPDIYFTRSTDAGATFEPPERLSNMGQYMAENVQVAVSGNNVFVVWNEYTDLFPEVTADIFFRKSDDYGRNFGPTINLSSNSGNSWFPQIAVAAGNVFVTWPDNQTNGNWEVFFTRSTDAGATFESTHNLSNNSGSLGPPRMVASGSDVYVSWRDNSFSASFDVLFIKSSDGGATFSNITNLSKSPGTSDDPEIASSGDGNVFVVWENTGPGNFDIFLAKSRDRGQTFDNSTNMSIDRPYSLFSKIAVGYNNTINLVWLADPPPGNWEIFYARGYDSGNLFDSAIDLSNSPRTSHHVQIITSSSSNNTYAIWDDASNNPSLWGETISGNNQISFRASNY